MADRRNTDGAGRVSCGMVVPKLKAPPSAVKAAPFKNGRHDERLNTEFCPTAADGRGYDQYDGPRSDADQYGLDDRHHDAKCIG